MQISSNTDHHSGRWEIQSLLFYYTEIIVGRSSRSNLHTGPHRLWSQWLTRYATVQVHRSVSAYGGVTHETAYPGFTQVSSLIPLPMFDGDSVSGFDLLQLAKLLTREYLCLEL